MGLGASSRSEIFCRQRRNSPVLAPPGKSPPYISSAGVDRRFFDEVQALDHAHVLVMTSV